MVKSASKKDLKQHFSEFKQGFIKILIFFICFFIIGYYFSDDIYNFLLHPLEINSNIDRRIIYTSPIEAFLSYLKLSFIFSLFCSFPVILLQIYLFLTPAFYKKERSIMIVIFLLSPLLFFIGICACYYGLLPLALEFFLTFENIDSAIPIILEARISEYLKLILNMLFIFGIIFQIPLLFILLIKFDKIDKNSLKKFRKYYIILSFIIGAIFTPPDIFSQLFVAVIMILFYEISLIFIRNK
ncbi:twin-arginine translocase subunit TatC [Rickettsiales bacterium]|nr:twin-arginine translocase subunit TatC [Rickettsiales bacterium]